jgi:hypothetical protein
MNLRLWEILRERLCACRSEDLVIATPYRQQGHLSRPEIVMQHWIQLHVAWIITCQFQLHLGVSWAPDQRIIMIPGVGTYQTLVRNPMRVLPLDGVQCESSSYSLFVGRVRRFSEPPDWLPILVNESFGVRVSVLADHGNDRSRIADRQSPADRSSVVLHVHCIAVDSESAEQGCSDGS